MFVRDQCFLSSICLFGHEASLLSKVQCLITSYSPPGLSELLVKDAISYIFLNPHIWVHTVYKVQREVYMFLIQQFDNDPRLLKSLCRLPRVLDIIRQFYWDNAESQPAVRSKPIVAMTDQIVGEKPDREEIHKIRLLLLSLGEMSLRYDMCLTLLCLDSIFKPCFFYGAPKL